MGKFLITELSYNFVEKINIWLTGVVSQQVRSESGLEMG